MTERYETTRSRGEPPLKLIFPAGAWGNLPFEVRLSRPWYGSDVCCRAGITAHQRSEIARRGYCIAEVEPVEADKPSIGNFQSRSATTRILIPILGPIATLGPNCANGGRSVDELSSGQLKGDHEGLVKVLDPALVLDQPGKGAGTIGPLLSSCSLIARLHSRHLGRRFCGGLRLSERPCDYRLS